MEENSEKLEQFLSSKNCRSCSNRCSLDDPMCNRSRIWIAEAMKKWEENH